MPAGYGVVGVSIRRYEQAGGLFFCDGCCELHEQRVSAVFFSVRHRGSLTLASSNRCMMWARKIFFLTHLSALACVLKI